MTIPLQPVAGHNTELDAYCTQLCKRLPANNRLLLVQIPQVILGSFNRDIALKRGYYAFPPTGLQYLYEAIKHRGLEVCILDLNYELLKRVFEDPAFDHNNWHILLEEELDRFDPGIVGISCLFDMAIGPMLEVLERVRQRNRSVVIAGGVIATYESKNLLSENLAHFVVRGEGENKLNFLLDKLTPKSFDTKATPGIFFNDGEMRESRGNPDVVMAQGNLIDSYNLVPIETYSKYGSLNPYSRQTDALGHAFAAIQLTRGCRAECTFCAVRDFMGKGVRSRSIDCVIEEMEFLYEKRDVRHFEWLDDDLLFDRHQIKDLLGRIIAKGWDIKWSANNGLIASSIDEEMMALIQNSGCIGFKIGIETGNAEMLRKVKKPGTHRRFLAFSKMVEAYPGPFIGGNFIVGLPGENFGQMMDSLRFSLEMNIDWSAITVCQVIRGASAFSDSGEYFEHQMKTKGSNIVNFIPARESTNGVVKANDTVKRNMEIFAISPDEVPSADQVKEIWFAFNIISNYICNKNLRPNGRPEKFIAWIETARRAYPSNPYMLMFLAIGHRLLGHDAACAEYLEGARTNVNTEYWRDRFAAFELDGLLNEFPATPAEVYDSLTTIRARLLGRIDQWISLPRGEYPRAADNPSLAMA